MDRTSVVVAWWSGGEGILGCLGSLVPQLARRGDDVEVLVVHPAGISPDLVGRVARDHPEVVLLEAPAPAAVFRLRAVGAERARGNLVALTEGHMTLGPDWLESLEEAFRKGHGCVGGPIENGLVERSSSWGLYLAEYGLHMPPVVEGPARSLSGANVAYARELLEKHRETWAVELRENEVQDALERSGVTPYMVPGAWACSHLPMDVIEGARHLYGGGRDYGRYRGSVESVPRCVVRLASTAAVPAVLLARILGRVVSRKPGMLGRLIRASGYLLLLLVAWSAGEARGYLDTLRPREGARSARPER